MPRENYYTHAQSVLHQWGKWARRPQFWANLRASGMYSAFPMPVASKVRAEIGLDPLSRRVHSSVMALDDRTAGVLYAYYVREITFDNAPKVFKRFGIERNAFYRILKDGTLRAFNGIKRPDARASFHDDQWETRP